LIAFVGALEIGLIFALAGLVTAWLNIKLKIMQLLAGILMMIALYSINLRIMGKPNEPLLDASTVFDSVPSGILPAARGMTILVPADRGYGGFRMLAERQVFGSDSSAWRRHFAS